MSASGIDDRQRSARMLLKHPLVQSSEIERYRLVKRHSAWLGEWFEINTGWAVHVDSEVVRLAKEPATLGDPTHPVVSRSGLVPFSRRRYVLLMLGLAALERSDAQISLGRLAEQVVLYGGTPELARSGFAFGLTTREERGDLVAVVQVLLDWHVLDRVAGDELEFVQNSGDALYDVSRRVLSQLLVTRRGPSTVAGRSLDDRLTALRDRGMPPSDELRNLRLRQSLTRRLLDDPVMYFFELAEEEADYLRGQRAAICRRITEFTGLVPEIRREGLAMVDLDDDLTDLRMPEKGTDGHVTLLVAEHLASSPQPEHSTQSLREMIRAVTGEYIAFWRASAAEAGADAALVQMAISRLVALHLAERTVDGVRALPALARFAVGEPTISEGARA